MSPDISRAASVILIKDASKIVGESERNRDLLEVTSFGMSDGPGGNRDAHLPKS